MLSFATQLLLSAKGVVYYTTSLSILPIPTAIAVSFTVLLQLPTTEPRGVFAGVGLEPTTDEPYEDPELPTALPCNINSSSRIWDLNP